MPSLICRKTGNVFLPDLLTSDYSMKLTTVNINKQGEEEQRQPRGQSRRVERKHRKINCNTSQNRVVAQFHDGADEILNHQGHEGSRRLVASGVSFVYLGALGGLTISQIAPLPAIECNTDFFRSLSLTVHRLPFHVGSGGGSGFRASEMAGTIVDLAILAGGRAPGKIAAHSVSHQRLPG